MDVGEASLARRVAGVARRVAGVVAWPGVAWRVAGVAWRVSDAACVAPGVARRVPGVVDEPTVISGGARRVLQAGEFKRLAVHVAQATACLIALGGGCARAKGKV